MLYLPDCQHENDWKANVLNDQFTEGITVTVFELTIRCEKCKLEGAILDGRQLAIAIKFLTRDAWKCRQDFFADPTQGNCAPFLHETNRPDGHKNCGWRNDQKE